MHMDPSYLGRAIPTPTAHKPRGLMTKRTLFLVLGGAAAVIVSGLLLLNSQDGSAQLQQRLHARQTTTIKLIADGQKNLSNDDLSKINSELSLILSGDHTELVAALKAAGLTKIDVSIKSTEADTEVFETLKTAKLNAQYDSAYQNILTQKLESLHALLKEVHGKTRSPELRTAIAVEYKHLTPYINALSELEKQN